MSLSQLKRALWVMNELVKANSVGISRRKLSKRWAESLMNDNGERELSERTFYRLRNELESLFDVSIVCSRDGEKRYFLEQSEYSVFLGMLCQLVTGNSKHSMSIQDLLLHVMKDMDIPEDEKRMIDTIAFRLNKIPYATGEQLIDAARDGKIRGADRAQWAEYEWHSACVWLEESYRRNSSWVGVHISRKGKNNMGEVRFYVVNESQDALIHSEMIERLNLENGIQRGGGYWWFAPREESLHTLGYVAFPDFETIKCRVELLLGKLNLF